MNNSLHWHILLHCTTFKIYSARRQTSASDSSSRYLPKPPVGVFLIHFWTLATHWWVDSWRKSIAARQWWRQCCSSRSWPNRQKYQKPPPSETNSSPDYHSCAAVFSESAVDEEHRGPRASKIQPVNVWSFCCMIKTEGLEHRRMPEASDILAKALLFTIVEHIAQSGPAASVWH